MTEVTKRLHLPDALAAAIRSAAQRAYPEECCGLIEGEDTADGWRAIAIHETANLAQDRARRFLIDPQAQFDLMRRLRETERRVIGCFHSHPGGRAEPSATDAAEACEPGFLYLSAAGAPERGFALAAFCYSEAEGFMPIALEGIG
jgi:proteasome lid subunit RPN8/RPN11